MQEVTKNSGFKKARQTLGIIFSMSLLFGIGYLLGYKGYLVSLDKFPIVTVDRSYQPERELDFSLFWDVWDRLENGYYDKSKIKHGDMVYGAIKGMVSSVGDPYTVFFTPKENAIVQEDLNGNFEGVGIQIDFKDSALTIVSALPGTPAQAAGVLPGDQIIKIIDRSNNVDKFTERMSLQEAIALIRGKMGTSVTLTIKRSGEDDLQEFDIQRSSINVPSVKLGYVGENESLAHVNVMKFGGETKAEWQKVVAEIVARQTKGVILDVRNNPGGYLTGAIEVATEFIADGNVVTEAMADDRRQEYKVYGGGKLYRVPLVVLVNEGSASASEILAGAIKDHKRGKLVGAKTFGKGTIQEPQALTNGAGLHLTISKWLTPNGVWINGAGLEPDIVVEDNSDTEVDEQLEKAIELLR
ncbi:MAG: hypothetical protein ACD_52C00264G0003 [uncultured bacterium]|nr:MAG: hypothetical protein ACD_52C00264G0003 [uncultured bacterium]